MERFEQFFEEGDQALEYTFGDLSAKWRNFWTEVFLPSYKKTMEELKKDVNSDDRKTVESAAKKLAEIEEECEKQTKAPNKYMVKGVTLKNYFRCFGAIFVAGFIPFIVASINDYIKSKDKNSPGYNFYIECSKVAAKTLPVAKALRKKAEAKLKSMKASESFDFEQFFEN